MMADNPSHQNNRSQVVTIDVLPDDVLLEIFDFCVFKYQDLQLLSVVSGSLKEREQIRSWQSLVHVCRRWRCLVFVSPRRLSLQLQVFHVPGAPTWKSLDVWPSLPLLIHGDLSSTPMNNVIAELEHSDRIHQINFYCNTIFQIEIENLWTAMQVPFPELEILRLSFKEGPNVPFLPDRFLGGSAPRLRYLELDSIPIRGLPNLLMSTTHLVYLHLHDIPHFGYISPNAVATCLSVLTSLEKLLLAFESPQSSPDQENRRSPPPTRSVLPALTWFSFKGVSEYLEGLVARIDTPRLEQLSVTFFNDIDFETWELIRFVGRSLTSNAPNEAHLLFDSRSASVKLLPHASSTKFILVKISCREPVWQLSSLAQICTTFLDLLSTTENLFIYEPASSALVWKDGIESIEWLELLLPFTAVKNLYISKEFQSRIAPALQEIGEGGPTEVLSTLQNLYLEGFKASVSVQKGIERFISGRQLANHPVAISVWDTATAATLSANFQLIFNNALDAYKKRTKKDLLSHPLAVVLQTCDSPSAILAVLHQQVTGLDSSTSNDERWTKWLEPTVNVLHTLSDTLGEGVSLVFSPGKVIFVGVAVLLLAAKDVRKSHETLIDIFERIGLFFQRIEIYTQVRPTTEMMNTIIQIMVEILSILGIATKEVKQSRIRKYGKRLIGRTDMEDALKRLDKLTNEEARMAVAENLRATHAVDEKVKGVTANVNDKVTDVIRGGEEAREVMDQTANDVDQVKQYQLRENIHKWLSPPDPSTNHSIACGTHHKKTATWLFKGSIYQEWKSKGSFIWIHGKPGSGKSVLSSTIIEDIRILCEANHGSMGYFYFDFRNANKQGLRDLLSSLLTQLSASSTARCDILSKLYSDHDDGKMRPSDTVLIKCLKDMLTLPGQHPIYLIIDALDESSATSGIPSARERVLQLLAELVDLRLDKLHVCVTSRPEIDIKDVLEPLTSLRVSLHDQTGQKEDIADYIRSVIYSNSEPIIRRWRKDDKDVVIKTLSERADGMFRWVFCQLEVLRHCLPPSVRRSLEELPESLDETYERVLREIKKPNRDYARRILQCLVVAIRPLHVEELAEVLAVDFDDGIPKLKPDWRWEDHEKALFTSCSCLIAIVDTGHSRVVQFSHFSVKEYLTSTRLTISSQDVSRYHIAVNPAHTILAQACISALLQSGDRDKQDDVEENAPLARYAAEYWVCHAQVEDVASHIKGMDYLFDLDKPYFAAWRQLYDIDTSPSDRSMSVFYDFTPLWKSDANSSLYYAALCGFADLVERLMFKYPEHVNTISGYYMTPAVAALAGRHFQVAEALHRNGSSVALRGYSDITPLHAATRKGDLKMVQVLLEYGADVNAQAFRGGTPLDFASEGYHDDPRVARLLIERGADLNLRGAGGFTPLHRASDSGSIEIARVLIELGASVGLKNNMGKTPLDLASEKQHEIVELPLEHGAGREDIVS